ncbi:hypothetical protein FRB90_004360, partial [Tulasnella sp. 427]
SLVSREESYISLDGSINAVAIAALPMDRVEGRRVLVVCHSRRDSSTSMDQWMLR